MSVKIKYRGEWLEADEAAYRRRQEALSANGPAPPVDVDALPSGQDLNAVGVACPDVRRYVNARGQIRSGLTKEERQTAQRILERCSS